MKIFFIISSKYFFEKHFQNKWKPFNDEFSLHAAQSIFLTKGKPLVAIS
jgi:hypothetical protein